MSTYKNAIEATILHYLALGGHAQAIKELIAAENCPAPFIADKYGVTPLHLAVMAGSSVRLFLNDFFLKC
jgi:ankyrin repeat protein